MYHRHENIPEATVADLLEFEQWPEERQRLVERLFQRSLLLKYPHLTANFLGHTS